MNSSALLLLFLIGCYGLSILWCLKEQGFFQAESSEKRKESIRCLLQFQIWGNGFILSLFVGSLLNLNALLAKSLETVDDYYNYITSSPVTVATFYLIPFMVSTATSFLAQCGNGCLFSLFSRSVSGKERDNKKEK